MSKPTYLTRTKITPNYVRYDAGTWCIYLPRFAFDPTVPFPVKIDVYAMRKYAQADGVHSAQLVEKLRYAREEIKRLTDRAASMTDNAAMWKARAEGAEDKLLNGRGNCDCFGGDVEVEFDIDSATQGRKPPVSKNLQARRASYKKSSHARSAASKKGWETRRRNAKRNR